MVVVDTFYQLIEKETRKVNGCWKVLHVLGYAFASVTGFCSTIWFYETVNSFDMNCILYPGIRFRPMKPEDPAINILPQNITIDAVTTIWNRDSFCQFCLAVWMISFVGGAICATFFIVHPKGGKGTDHSMFSQPWKMISPMVVVSVLMVILTGVACFQHIGGMNAFCASFQNLTGEQYCTDKIDLYSLKFNKQQKPVNMSRKIVSACSSAAFIAWACSLLLLLFRIFFAPDFKIQIINILPRERLVEEVTLNTPSRTVLQRHRVLRIQQLPVDDENIETAV